MKPMTRDHSASPCDAPHVRQTGKPIAWMKETVIMKIQFVVNSMVDCTDQHGTPQNPGAPVKGGDAIVLVGAAGHDANLEITGCYNSDWVTIRAASFREPVLSSVHFRGSGLWRLSGLSFFNDSNGTMVRVEDHSSQGPARNIQILNNHFTSGDLPTIPDWVDHVSDAMRLYTGNGPLLVRCNELVNVAMGFVVGGDHTDVIGNTVEYFSRDGIATGGHFNRFIGNRIYDSVKLGDGHHDDFLQSHMGANHELQPGDELIYFADWLGFDLSLVAGSPAIDSGNPDGATTHDIAGTPRDAQPDIGAYEFITP
jgi:hypothetical protein